MDKAEEFVDECMKLSKLLEEAVQDGFTEVILRNPETGEKKVLSIPAGPSR